MKMLIATVALASAIALPAFAQNMNRRAAEPPADRSFAQSRQGASQSFTLRGQPNSRAHSARRSTDVYDTRGEYVGSDPDPFIRSQLLRDVPGRDEE
jgi:hypothetical protein